jgi:NAD(P) transhydrogenase subunit beta
MSQELSALIYLFATALFIFGLKRLSSPATARSGNQLAAAGMAIAIVVTLTNSGISAWTIIAGIVVGSGVGAYLARTVEMTGMPELVAAFNGFGGGASVMVASAEFLQNPDPAVQTIVTIALSVVIGAITFSGSFMAWGKLNGKLPGQPFGYPAQKLIDPLIVATIVFLGVLLVLDVGGAFVLWTLLVLGLVLGVTRVMPIGGADMPVVISLLNAFSGVAASMAGFVINENALIISGALVGASGLILTNIMVKAMNRSIAHVLFAAFGGADSTGQGGTTSDKPVKAASAEDVAITMGYARSVIVVPGYGLAVAQAQHVLRELADLLEAKGVDVRYAIHPVAGRMPGHMNVLLAEADVSYDKLFALEDINGDFPRTDVALIVGANDVVNPAARDDETSPIYGMPILDVDFATTSVVIKRSLSPGFAGIDNPLFYHENNLMFFGDAKAAIQELVKAVAEL